MTMPAIEPGTVYGPWTVGEAVGTHGRAPTRVRTYAATCGRCGGASVVNTRTLLVARRRGYAGCDGCRRHHPGDVIGAMRLLRRDRGGAWLVECIRCCRQRIALASSVASSGRTTSCSECVWPADVWDGERHITRREAADRLGVSRQRIQQILVKRGPYALTERLRRTAR